MQTQDVLDRFKKTGAIRSGHFRLSSGRHSDTYIQCARVLQYPRLTAELIEPFRAKIDDDIDVIVSPAVGAIPFGCMLAYLLECRFVFAERVEGKFSLRRGFIVEAGEKVIIAEDVITTGGSVLEIAAMVESMGAKVAGIATMVHRGEAIEMPYKVDSLLTVRVESFEPEGCPLCQKEVPLDTPGSRYLLQ